MLDELLDLVKRSRSTVVLTGAGVSTLSGIPDFRGEHGIYRADFNGMAVEEILSRDCFLADPSIFYRWAQQFVYRLEDFHPSIVHTTLAKMEQKGLIEGVYTQNIDMLHQKGGSRKVWELHGSPETHHCLSCSFALSYEKVKPIVLAHHIPRCPRCSSVVKPDIVFYGDDLDVKLLDQAYRDMGKADLLLVLGSSLTVQPVASLPLATYYHGGKIVIVNAQATPLDKQANLIFRDLQETFHKLDAWVDTQ